MPKVQCGGHGSGDLYVISSTTTATRDQSAPAKKAFRDHRDFAGMLDKPEKLTKWTNDFTDALDWLILKLGTLRSEQYFANVFDHRQKRSVLKETRQGGPSAY